MARILSIEPVPSGIFVLRPTAESSETNIIEIQGDRPACPDGYEVKQYDTMQACMDDNPDVVAENEKAVARQDHDKKWHGHDLKKIYKLKEEQAERVVAGETLAEGTLLAREAVARGIDITTLANQVLQYTRPTQALEDQEIIRVSEKLSLSS